MPTNRSSRPTASAVAFTWRWLTCTVRSTAPAWECSVRVRPRATQTDPSTPSYARPFVQFVEKCGVKA